jgi:DNA-binding NarL/FixJ family response regulator
LLRSLMAKAIALEPNLEVVGEVADAESAIESCGRLCPSVVLLDCLLPGQQGPEAVAALLRASPRSRVLMCSGILNPLSLRRSFAAGARGFLEKNASIDEMVEAIRAVYAGRFYCSSASRPLVQQILSHAAGDPKKPALSDRELDVLAGVARGLSSKQIAANLGLSVFTVENHRRRIMDRIGVKSLAGLVLLAVELNLVDAAGLPSRP